MDDHILIGKAFKQIILHQLLGGYTLP